MNPLRKLSARWAIVTGASSGIGLEFARQLAAAGCNILAVSNQPDKLNAITAELAATHGIQAIPLPVDLTAPGAVADVMQALAAHGITPALLVNNAGIFDFKAVENLSPQRIDLYIDLHMRAVTHLSRNVAMLMTSSRQKGWILNMSSMSCWMPMPGIAMYSATKAYIRAFSRALRVEMKPRGISVTVACPGGIATGLFGLPPRLQRLGVAVGALATPQKFVRHALNRTLRGKPQYINGTLNRLAIAFVASLPEWARLQIKTRLLDLMDHPSPNTAKS